MEVLSLFDGISCGRLALRNIGVDVKAYYSSEIDKKAISVSEKNFNDIKRLGDVKEVSFKGKELDLLIGGSPCQSFSRQGNGSGFEGKSGLFWEFVRIMNESKPKKFLLENVEMKKEWQNIITKEMGVEPIFINSGSVSAQNRRRIYWTNIDFKLEPKSINLKDLVEHGYFEQEEDLNRLIVGKTEEGLLIKNATKKGYLLARNFDGVSLQFPNSKTRRGRVQSEKIPTLDTSCDVGVVIDGKLRRLNISEIEKAQGLPIGFTEGFSERERKKMIGNAWQVDTIEQIFKGLKN